MVDFQARTAEAHPTQGALLHTKCIIVSKYRTLVSGSRTWKFNPAGRGGGSIGKRGGKAGYIKVKQYGFQQESGLPMPGEEIYLHKLLCFMYRGPGPAKEEVSHVCENKLCMAPWHMRWVTHQQNMEGYHVHRADRTQYHDPR